MVICHVDAPRVQLSSILISQENQLSRIVVMNMYERVASHCHLCMCTYSLCCILTLYMDGIRMS